MRRRYFVVIVALVLASWYLSSIFFPDDQKQIYGVFDQLIEQLELDGRSEEHPIISLDKAQEAAKFFSDDFQVLVRIDDREKQHSLNRKDLAKALTALRRRAVSIQLDYDDVRMRIKDQQATVTLTAQAIWRFPGENELYRERRIGKLKLEKLDGRWQIVFAENVEPFQWYED